MLDSRSKRIRAATLAKLQKEYEQAKMTQSFVLKQALMYLNGECTKEEFQNLSNYLKERNGR